MMWNRVMLNEKHDEDRANSQLGKRSRYLANKYIPYIENNLGYSRDIPSFNIYADFLPDPNDLTDSSSPNRTRLPTQAAACDHYLIRDYVGVFFATIALTHYGCITKDDNTHVIEPHKLRDAIQKYQL